MAAHVQDEQIDQLAERAQRILNAPSKTDAVRQALSGWLMRTHAASRRSRRG
jgi:antitoxin VapB